MAMFVAVLDGSYPGRLTLGIDRQPSHQKLQQACYIAQGHSVIGQQSMCPQQFHRGS